MIYSVQTAEPGEKAQKMIPEVKQDTTNASFITDIKYIFV